jgi:hypothetical protein
VEKGCSTPGVSSRPIGASYCVKHTHSHNEFSAKNSPISRIMFIALEVINIFPCFLFTIKQRNVTLFHGMIILDVFTHTFTKERVFTAVLVNATQRS